MPEFRSIIEVVAFCVEAIIFLVLNEQTLQTNLWIKRKRSIVCASVGTLALGLVIAAFTAVPFAWEITQDAVSITLHRTFSTTLWAIFRDVGVAGFVALRIRMRWGTEEVNKYIRNARDAAEAIMAAFAVTVIYHLAVTLPRDIDAAAVVNPVLPAVWRPLPPLHAYAKPTRSDPANPPSAKSEEPMDRGYPHVLEIKIHAEMVGSHATVLIGNIGRYRIISPAMVRGAIISSRPLEPDEEKKYLFSGQENGQKGGLITFQGNYWDPGDAQQIEIRSEWPFNFSEWKEISDCTKEDCKRVIYVVTKTYSKDKFGSITPKESCWYVSAIDWSHAKKCFGHND